MFRSLLFTSLIWCGFVSIVFGHGQQIQLTIDSNKITTREVLLDTYGPGITSPKSLYVMPIVASPTVLPPGMPNGNLQWLTYPTDSQPVWNSGPGIAYPFGFSATDTFKFKILDSLKVWNGSVFVDPGSEQLEVFRGNAGAATPTAAIFTNDTINPLLGPFPEISVPYFNDFHSTIRYRLLGTRSTDPNTVNDRIVEPDDGIYLAKFAVGNTQSGIADSDPFYFLLNKNASAAEYAGAINGAMASFGINQSQIQAIPEPSTWAMGALGLLGLSCLRYLRHRS